MEEMNRFYTCTTEYCKMKMNEDKNWKKYIIDNNLYDDVLREAVYQVSRSHNVLDLSYVDVIQWYENLCKQHEMHTGFNFSEYCFICSTSDCMDNILKIITN